ncbi:hypothetical protein [Microcoleus sp. herbarium14]|uniref:hypothetical protein n=1 Tax=Microcoleus sp. herbarium14 TaxID=3055439 RepID=UPI002FD1BEFB
MAKVPHLVDTTGSGKLVIVLEEATYASVGTILGITKLAVGSAPPAGSYSDTSTAAVQKGKLGSLRVTLRTGIKRASRKLLCSLDKMDTVTAEIVGKSIGAGVITSARFPTRRRLR